MATIENFFSSLDWWQIAQAFIFLFAIVDPFGNMPVTLSMEARGVKIYPHRVCIASVFILLAFLFLGEWVLKIFGVQIEYFAIAGGFIVFLMALEMILDIVIFKADVDGEGSIVPLAFPMYAGPGAFTALLSLTASYSTANLVVAVFVVILLLYAVLIGTRWLSKYIGKTTLYIIRKFFGIIVLAISVKLMFGNIALLFHA